MGSFPGTRLLSKLSKDKRSYVVYPTKLIEAVEKATISQTEVFPHRQAKNWPRLRPEI
jgi:hypothetical protein